MPPAAPAMAPLRTRRPQVKPLSTGFCKWALRKTNDLIRSGINAIGLLRVRPQKGFFRPFTGGRQRSKRDTGLLSSGGCPQLAPPQFLFHPCFCLTRRVAHGDHQDFQRLFSLSSITYRNPPRPPPLAPLKLRTLWQPPLQSESPRPTRPPTPSVPLGPTPPPPPPPPLTPTGSPTSSPMPLSPSSTTAVPATSPSTPASPPTAPPTTPAAPD